MTQERRSDETVIAEERRRHRRTVIQGLITMAGIATFWGLIYEAAADKLLPPSLSRHPVLTIMALVFILIIVQTPFILRNTPPMEAFSEHILRKQIDDHHQRWRGRYLLIALSSFLFTGFFSLALAHGVPIAKFWGGALFVFVTLAYAMPIVFSPAARPLRKIVDDELTAEMRIRATKMGYLMFTLALCGGFTAALYRPEWAVQILIWIAFAGTAIPALYYAFLDWRAGRDG